MEQNPVNIVVVIIGMAFVFLGLMQYMSSMGKNNANKQNELFDKWQSAKSEVSDLKDQNERLLEALETSNMLAKRWEKAARSLHRMWKEEKAKNAEIRGKVQ